MTSNIPAITDVYADLERVLAKLQAISADQIESANLVPMVKAVQSIGAFQAAIDAQIQARAIGNNELIPGMIPKRLRSSRKSSLAIRHSAVRCCRPPALRNSVSLARPS